VINFNKALDKLKSFDPRKITAKASISWMKKQIKNLTGDMPRMVTKLEIGKLYLFVYDAKHKDTLPFWDKFPLAMPYNYNKNKAVLSINFHYLAPKTRKLLMEKLLKTTNNLDETKALSISYELLNGVSKFKEVAPATTSYLYPHIKSKVLEIPPSMWNMVLMLPIANFQGASSGQVYKQSKGKI